MEYKDFNGAVSDVDTTSRRVKVVISEMGSKDLDNDIIDQHAYDKTIAERGPKGKNVIYHLRDHDASISRGLITKFSELYVEGNRLIGVSVMPNTSIGNDMMEHYSAGNINQHSVGFQAISAVPGKDGAPRLIKEIKLFEGSAVLHGANPNTPTLSVGKGLFKCLNTAQEIRDSAEELFSEYDDLYREIKQGYPADNYELLQMRLDLFKTWVKRLVLSTQAIPEIPGPQKDEKMMEVLKRANTLLRNAPVVKMAPPDKRQAALAGRMKSGFRQN